MADGHDYVLSHAPRNDGLHGYRCVGRALPKSAWLLNIPRRPSVPGHGQRCSKIRGASRGLASLRSRHFWESRTRFRHVIGPACPDYCTYAAVCLGGARFPLLWPADVDVDAAAARWAEFGFKPSERRQMNDGVRLGSNG